MMRIILLLHKQARRLISAGVPISSILATGLFDKLVKMKYDIPNNKLEMFDEYAQEIEDTLSHIVTN